MAEPELIKGPRAIVAMSEVDGGYAWHCRACNSRAGVGSKMKRPDGVPFLPTSGPFVDGTIYLVVDGEKVEITRTGEEHCRHSAEVHANERCAGQAAKAWRPPTYHPEEE